MFVRYIFLNGSLSALFNDINIVLTDALNLQNQAGSYITSPITKNLPNNRDYGFLFIIYGSQKMWRLLVFIPTALDGIYINHYNAYGDPIIGWIGWVRIS